MFRLWGQYIPLKTVVLAATESLLVLLALLAATFIRLGNLDEVAAYLSEPTAPWKFVVAVAVCLLSFYYNDLYNSQAMARVADMLVHLLQALGAAMLLLAVLYYAVPSLALGRGIATVGGLLVGVVLLGWRLLVDAMGRSFRPTGRLLIAGTGTLGIRVVEEILARPELNIEVVGFLDEKGENIGKSLVNPRIVGAVSEVEDFVRRERIDRVVLSFTERRGRMPLRQLLRVRLAGVPVEDAHAFYERLTGKIQLDWLNPSSLFLAEGFRKSRVLLFQKRLVDILVSLAALLLLSPLFLIVSLAIYLESGRPIFFRQRRVGMGGRTFWILKFRSMHQDAERNGPAWATATDARVTRVGRLIRRFRIDESPQFINVLQGDMSLVGPRPERPEFVRLLEEQIPYYGERHSVRPGITGWAQIKYRYGASVEDSKSKLEYDFFYIKHLTLSFDLLIIFRTVQVVLFGRGAV